MNKVEFLTTLTINNNVGFFLKKTSMTKKMLSLVIDLLEKRCYFKNNSQ